MLLAIDRSTRAGSAAVFSVEGHRTASVFDDGAGQGDADGLLGRLLREAAVETRALTRFAVGIGPGSFSGIRSAIALLSGLALPIGASVEGVSSAAAVDAVFRETVAPDATVVVVGDARRGRLWVSVFEPDTRPKHDATDFQLVTADALQSVTPAGAMVVTPDDARIGDWLRTVFPAERVYAMLPTATAVARLALQGSSALALPIYLQPAVV